MRVNLCFVPPGGGEADYSLDFELPAIPNAGDYISIKRRDQPAGTEDFIVRRTWWSLETNETRTHHSGNAQIGSVAEIMVECEFAEGPWSTESHKRGVAMYDTRGKGKREFDNSCY